jgi:hypothetical protein
MTTQEQIEETKKLIKFMSNREATFLEEIKKAESQDAAKLRTHLSHLRYKKAELEMKLHILEKRI